MADGIEEAAEGVQDVRLKRRDGRGEGGGVEWGGV